MNVFLFRVTCWKMTLVFTIIANFTICWTTPLIMCSRTKFPFYDDFGIWILISRSVRFLKFVNLVNTEFCVSLVKVLTREKVTFFESSNNHQIVVKWDWNSFWWSYHQIQSYYVLPLLVVSCRLIVCWIWLRLISWSLLWYLIAASVHLFISSNAYWCFHWNWILVEGWIYPHQTDYCY